jgi:hypothetical protein
VVFSMAIASAMGIPASFPLSLGGDGAFALFDPLRLPCAWALKNGSPPPPAPTPPPPPAPLPSAAVVCCSLTGGGATQGGVPRPITATLSGPATSRN